MSSPSSQADFLSPICITHRPLLEDQTASSWRKAQEGPYLLLLTPHSLGVHLAQQGFKDQRLRFLCSTIESSTPASYLWKALTQKEA
ncbi:hypothetical protein VULLAG_LOCUS12586 [Vulpes lagopus]